MPEPKKNDSQICRKYGYDLLHGKFDQSLPIKVFRISPIRCDNFKFLTINILPQFSLFLRW